MCLLRTLPQEKEHPFGVLVSALPFASAVASCSVGEEMGFRILQLCSQSALRGCVLGVVRWSVRVELGGDEPLGSSRPGGPAAVKRMCSE